MIISHSVVPNGGWAYTQGKIRLVGETFDLLKENVRSHRYHNGIPIGDLEGDIEKQIGASNPHLVKLKVMA